VWKNVTDFTKDGLDLNLTDEELGKLTAAGDVLCVLAGHGEGGTILNRIKGLKGENVRMKSVAMAGQVFVKNIKKKIRIAGFVFDHCCAMSDAPRAVMLGGNLVGVDTVRVEGKEYRAMGPVGQHIGCPATYPRGGQDDLPPHDWKDVQESCSFDIYLTAFGVDWRDVRRYFRDPANNWLDVTRG